MARPAKAVLFYATPEEVASWLSDWRTRHGLHAVFGRVFPSPAMIREVNWEDPGEVLNVVSQQEVVCLGTAPLQSDVTSINQVPVRNPNCLVIQLPSLTADGLGYGSISSGATDPTSARTWKSILKELASRTRAGIWYSVPGRSKRTPERDARFSPGAEALFRGGTRLVGGGNTVVAQLGDGKDAPPADAGS
jgi:hypothetical protein